MKNIKKYSIVSLVFAALLLLFSGLSGQYGSGKYGSAGGSGAAQDLSNYVQFDNAYVHLTGDSAKIDGKLTVSGVITCAGFYVATDSSLIVKTDSFAALTGNRTDYRAADTAGITVADIDSIVAAIIFKKTISMIEVNNDSSGALDTVNWTMGNRQKIFLNTVGATIIFTAPQGPSVLTLVLIQNGAGSKTITTWPAAVKWPSGVAPTLTTTASAVDIVSFYYNGTNYYAQAALDMK